MVMDEFELNHSSTELIVTKKFIPDSASSCIFDALTMTFEDFEDQNECDLAWQEGFLFSPSYKIKHMIT